jgi:hypothetical protein
MIVQPVMEILDHGNNRLLADYTTTITSDLVVSPSIAKTLKIDTIAATNATVTDVLLSISNQTIGVGEIVIITGNIIVYFILLTTVYDVDI